MAGTLVANTINTDTGLFSTNNAYSGIAKAWVNFSCPSTTVTVNNSFNVSSVTRNTTGDYTLNFTTALADANYNAVFGCISSGLRFALENGDSPVRTTTQLRIYSLSGANAPVDNTVISVSIFR